MFIGFYCNVNLYVYFFNWYNLIWENLKFEWLFWSIFNKEDLRGNIV